MTTDLNQVKVFLSYAHEDEVWLKKLEAHLSLLQRQGVISAWHDRQIVPGTNWSEIIDQRLEQASIILFLVSADFLASDYCYEVEMTRALERHEAGIARVIPIAVRPADWKGAPFAHLRALPTNAKAITTWSNQDEAFVDVVAGIRRAIKDLSFSPASPLQSTSPSKVANAIPYRKQSSFLSSFVNSPKTNISSLSVALNIIAILVIILASAVFVFKPSFLFGVSSPVPKTSSIQNHNPGSGANTNSTATATATTTSTPNGTGTATAITTSTVHYQPGQLVYQVTDWTTWQGSTEWKVVGASTYGSDGTDNGRSGKQYIAWAPSLNLPPNYAIEATVTFIRSTGYYGDYEIDLMGRGDGGSNGYGVGVYSSGCVGICDHEATVSLIGTGLDMSQNVPKTELNKSGYTLDNKLHTFRAEFGSNSIKLYIDGSLHISTIDNTYIDSGRVGLRMVTGDVNITSFKVLAL